MEPPVKKQNIEVSSSKEKSESNDPDVQEEQQTVLSYDVLRIIFVNLGAKDLSVAAQVCRLWREAALKESSLRQAPEYLLKRFKIRDRDDSEDMYASELIGEEIRIKPVLALICAKVYEQKQWTFKGCFCQNLPSNCSAISLGGYDIVSDDSTIEKGFGMAVCSFLPAIPMLSHKIFHVDKHTFSGASNIDIKAHVDDVVRQLLPSRNEKSKCIIMLTNYDGYQFNKLIMTNLQKVYPVGKLSLWGGICTDLKICEASDPPRTCSKVPQWTAITLSSPSLKSWSIVLSCSCRKAEQIEEKLETFKQNIQLKKHSLGLMFACCERLKKKVMEITVFKKVFPSIPLIGLHGDGEYGLNTLNNKRENKLDHSYSTIFLILTYQ